MDAEAEIKPHPGIEPHKQIEHFAARKIGSQFVQRQKPPEVIQAQLATFTAETVGDLADRLHIFNNMGTLVGGGEDDVVRVVTDGSEIVDGVYTKLPPHERKVATAEEYLQFLRSVGGARYEDIHGRAEMLTAYDEFAPTIEHLNKYD